MGFDLGVRGRSCGARVSVKLRLRHGVEIRVRFWHTYLGWVGAEPEVDQHVSPVQVKVQVRVKVGVRVKVRVTVKARVRVQVGLRLR